MHKPHCLFALTAAACLSPAVALAATKISGTCVFGPIELHMVTVGDHEGHALGVSQSKCSWTKPIDFGGDKTKDGIATHTLESDGRASRYKGVLVATTVGGDRISFIYTGGGESQKGIAGLPHEEGTFTLSDGTGKLKNVTGKGTFRCTKSPEGNFCDIDGEYQAGR